MKKALGTLFKIFFYLSYPILIIALIVSVTLLVLKVRELDQVNNTFVEATSELNAENEDKQITIEDLKSEFTNLTNQVATLRAENTELKSSLESMQLEGYGTVNGKIFPVVTPNGSSFSQYQKVCAELVSNPNIQTCRTVSALQQNFSLSLPVGNYKVFAEIFPAPADDSPLAGKKTYYTEYIKCAQEKSAEECNQNKLTKAVVVEVKSGATLNNIDPIDWR